MVSLDGSLEGSGPSHLGDLRFRPLRHDDLPQLVRWLAEPHVEEWWHERLDLEAARAKYAPRIEGREPCHVFVIVREGRAIGWIQWYRWADYPEHAARLGATVSEAGIDLAIGDREHVGRGVGSRAIRAFVEQIVFADTAITGCVSDPEEANVRSVRAFEKAGFVVTRTTVLAGEATPRCVMRRPRDSSRP